MDSRQGLRLFSQVASVIMLGVRGRWGYMQTQTGVIYRFLWSRPEILYNPERFIDDYRDIMSAGGIVLSKLRTLHDG